MINSRSFPLFALQEIRMLCRSAFDETCVFPYVVSYIKAHLLGRHKQPTLVGSTFEYFNSFTYDIQRSRRLQAHTSARRPHSFLESLKKVQGMGTTGHSVHARGMRVIPAKRRDQAAVVISAVGSQNTARGLPSHTTSPRAKTTLPQSECIAAQQYPTYV